MNFVDEENIVFLKVGQKRRQVTRTLKNGAGSLAQVDAHFVGYDVSQRRFAQARRPEHQQMVKRLAALLGGGNEDFELFAHRLLANVIGQSYRAKGAVDAFFIRACCFRGDDAFDVLHEKNFLPFEKLVCHGF